MRSNFCLFFGRLRCFLGFVLLCCVCFCRVCSKFILFKKGYFTEILRIFAEIFGEFKENLWNLVEICETAIAKLANSGRA